MEIHFGLQNNKDEGQAGGSEWFFISTSRTPSMQILHLNAFFSLIHWTICG